MIPLGNNMETYLLAAFFSLVAAGCVAGGAHFLVGQKNRKEELFAQWETERDEGPDLEETQVRILKKYCMATMYGTKSPQSRKEFFLTSRRGTAKTSPTRWRKRSIFPSRKASPAYW